MRRTALTLVILTAMVLCGAQEAAAQGQAPAPADTARLGGPRPRLETKYTGGIKGDVNQVSMSNRIGANINLGNGLTSITSLSGDEAEYRIEDRSITNKAFLSNLIYPVMPGLALNGGISDTRSFNRLITSTGLAQDFINNIQKADASAQYGRVLGGGLFLNGATTLSASRAEQTFETNQSEDGATALGVRYGIGSKFEATARGFLRVASQESESGGRSFSGLGASEDSVLARARIVVRDSATVRAEYARYTSEKDFLDIPRTSQGGLAISDTVQVTPEVESRDVKNIMIAAESRPMRGLKLTLRAEHSDAATYFAKAQQRTGRDTGDLVSGNVTYSPGAKTVFSFDFDKRETLRWLGPERTGHYNDEDKKIRFSLTQTITGSLRMTAQAGASLAQTFYLDPDQDGDRDQRYVYANVRLTSKMTAKVDATVYVNAAKTDFIRVRASQSANNRQETMLELRPEFTYRITPRVELTQKYGLNIQFADYVFQENENFLDRIMSFSNVVRARLSTRIGVDFLYTLQLHDKGSYLRPEPKAARVLVVNQEERRDEVKVSFRYQISRRFVILGANDYSQRKDLLSSSPNKGLIKNGGVEIGIDGNYEIGAKGALKLAMKRVKRFGRFNAEAQNDYWVMDSSLNYRF